MAEQNKRKFGVLGAARRSTALTVELTPEDVRRLRPAWSGPQAEHFLQLHKVEIAHVLLETGLAVLNKLITDHESEARYDNN